MMTEPPSSGNATPPSPEVPETVYTALQSSGFPFQTAIERAISSTRGWSVLNVEFPWQDREGSDQFLDIIAGYGRYTVGVECKKTRKETLTFLLPQGPRSAQVDRAWLLYAFQITDESRRWELFCAMGHLAPASYESSFCVVSTSASGKDQRLLERDVARLILGTDAYTQRALTQIKISPDDVPGRPFVPVLVTNAPLFVACYDPSEVSLATGEFLTHPKDVRMAPWVRFRKSFPSSGSTDLGDRTCFVVNAERLSQFLTELGETICPPPDASAPRMHLPRLRR